MKRQWPCVTLRRNGNSCEATASLAGRWRYRRSMFISLTAIDVEAAITLACEHKIYAYDAYFLQCALQLRCPLLSLDRTTIRIAKAVDVPLVEQA